MSFARWSAAAICAAAMLTAAPAALAWSNQGHMVTGAVAYDDLAAASPALVAKVEAVMSSHPDKARFERGLAGLTGEARSRRLFELMARWPDDIRRGPYDHPAWHYWFRLVMSKSDPVKLPPQLQNLATGQAADAYDLNLATVRDAFAPAAERAVSLCWLFHLAGDIQQPLHAGHLASGRFPLSDRGGESDFVKPANGGAAINLHEYWDNAIGGDDDQDANVEAVRLRLEKAWARPDLKELDGKASPEAFRAWAEESLNLARSTVYVEGTFEGAASAAAAQPVSAAYEATRLSVGQRRVALGGHRIADTVRAALAP